MFLPKKSRPFQHKLLEAIPIFLHTRDKSVLQLRFCEIKFIHKKKPKILGLFFHEMLREFPPIKGLLF